MKANIIPMSEAYKGKLTAYLKQKFPLYTDTYIDYDVKESIGDQKNGTESLIVVNEEDNIVGCHLCFITKAWIKGEERRVVWGHNTYLDEDYRRIIGMDLILKIAAIKNGFGYGLTDINYKIQKLIKSTIFINGLRKYYKTNPWYLWGLILKISKIKPKIPTVLQTTIQIKDEIFHLCKNSEEIDIPNEGYWNKEICEVDFIRDNEFLNKRFFCNTVNKYYVYTNSISNCYFVVRPILHNGILCLQISDLRYHHSLSYMAKLIFHAIDKICRNIHAGAILFTTSDKNIRNLFIENKFCKSYPVAFVCGKKDVTSENAYIIVNAADSDDEFHK